jgi:hypothetical protein
MRFALLLVIALSACASKKQAPKSPASPAATQEAPKEETGATNVDSDKDADDPKPLSSDPEEGGQ